MSLLFFSLGCDARQKQVDQLSWPIEVATAISKEFEFDAWRGRQVQLGNWSTKGKEAGLRALGAPPEVQVTIQPERAPLKERYGKSRFLLIKYKVGKRVFECSMSYTETARFKSWTMVDSVDWRTGVSSLHKSRDNMISALAFQGYFQATWTPVVPVTSLKEIPHAFYDDLVGKSDTDGRIYIRDARTRREYVFKKVEGVCALGSMSVRKF
ncbi:MAG: hypothetical protein ABL949_17210 [Fimbriimonadaceae bacterium]